MRKVILIILVLGFMGLLIFILVESPAFQRTVTEITAPVQQEEILTQADIATILMIAINDIEKQGCTAIFLSERGGYIWCKCKDGRVKYYGLKLLIEQYTEGKLKAKESQDVEKTGRY